MQIKSTRSAKSIINYFVLDNIAKLISNQPD